MIKRFGFKNFSSFKEGAEISFEFDGNTPKSVSNGNTIGTVLGIKGANGSGKTNILKALTFLYCLASKRMQTQLEKENDIKEIALPFKTFFYSEEPSEFYIELLINGITYYYEVDVTNKGIKRELYVKEEDGKEVVFLERIDNEITRCDPDYEELKNVKLKEDQSLVRLPNDFNFHSRMDDLVTLYSEFKTIFFNVGPSGMKINADDHAADSYATFYKANPDALEFVRAVIMSGDEGIHGIEIRTLKMASGEDVDYPVFIHKHEDKAFMLLFSDESMGTKVLFNNLYKYWLTLKNGGVLIFDEFDIHLHSMILPEVIKLFTNPKTNPKNAQLIITAHNTEIIDSLGRYRTILVNKDNNESYCYRLDSISMLRNDRPISPFYQKGKIGGIPKSVAGLTDRIIGKPDEVEHD
ncbi:AAA family ATPase [Shewanella baltica]|uniref:AAA family ATPase n=1 Tax=Shewanella baltica TaxID=62322 RepID=UPI002167A09E|nr:AAA family ATPase [Shewanella baltica]MCS6116644.1 AAA family ATPase [Shewanella baltica]UVW66452.1 AAA family ATPase [Shewanella baltica]